MYIVDADVLQCIKSTTAPTRQGTGIYLWNDKYVRKFKLRQWLKIVPIIVHITNVIDIC